MSEYSFSFSSQGYAADTFTVLNFEGSESVSQCYALNIEVACDDTNLNAQALLQESCSLAVLFDGESVKQFHGILETYEEISRFEDRVIYQLRLVPRLWQLGLTTTNEVYIEQNIQTTLDLILQEAGFTADIDFRFALAKSYRKWPFRLQYKETYLDFIQRVIEREGIYYFFEQNEQAETLVFCDNNADIPSAGPSPLRFQLQGAVQVDPEPVFTQFICRQSRVPHKVVLRDFNEASPSLDVKGEAIINEDQKRSTGEINIYGLNILDVEEGEALAEIHASAYRCRQTEYSAVGDVAVLSAGHSFKMSGHPSKKLNEGRYIVDSIHHQGNNGTFVLNESDSSEQVSAYTNQAIVLDLANTYGVQANAHKPEINGTLNAVIDAEGDGEYAELDDFGRYLVKLPFDRRDSEGGKDSCWVRMMQPSGGVGSGMHFPLLKGTRVLLSFIGGDPDRPVISGTIGDLGEQSSIVNNENQTNSMIKTHTGNKIEIEDKGGTQRIKLETPHQNTYFHLGAPNAPGSGITTHTDGMITKTSLEGSREAKTVKGKSAKYKDDNDKFDPMLINTFKRVKQTGVGKEYGAALIKADEESGEHFISREVGDKYNYTLGDTFNSGDGTTYNFGSGRTENWIKQPSRSGNLNHYQGSLGVVHDHLEGESSETFTYGNQFNRVEGFTLSQYIGNTDEIFEGTANKTFLGASSEFCFGATFGLFAGASSATWLGLGFDLFLGGKVTVQAGLNHTFNMTPDIRIGPAEANLKLTDWQATQAQIKTLVSSTGVTANQLLVVAQETQANAQKITTVAQEVNANASKIAANANDIKSAASEIRTTAALIENGLTTTNNMVNEVSARVSKIENGATKLKFCGLEISF